MNIAAKCRWFLVTITKAESNCQQLPVASAQQPSIKLVHPIIV